MAVFLFYIHPVNSKMVAFEDLASDCNVVFLHTLGDEPVSFVKHRLKLEMEWKPT